MRRSMTAGGIQATIAVTLAVTPRHRLQARKTMTSRPSCGRARMAVTIRTSTAGRTDETHPVARQHRLDPVRVGAVPARGWQLYTRIAPGVASWLTRHSNPYVERFMPKDRPPRPSSPQTLAKGWERRHDPASRQALGRCPVCGTDNPRYHDTLCIRALYAWELEVLGVR